MPILGFAVGYFLGERKNERNVPKIELDDHTMSIIKKCMTTGKVVHGEVDENGNFRFVEKDKT